MPSSPIVLALTPDLEPLAHIDVRFLEGTGHIFFGAPHFVVVVVDIKMLLCCSYGLHEQIFLLTLPLTLTEDVNSYEQLFSQPHNPMPMKNTYDHR